MYTQFPKDCPAQSKPCVSRERDQFHSLSEIIDAYIDEHRDGAYDEMDFFKSRPSLQSAIEYATLSKLPNEHRHPHQYRRAEETLVQAESKLQASAHRILSCRSFEELRTFVCQEIGPIPDIGPLTVYDVATRIGAYLNLEPERVYLHTGTTEGAKNLGLDCRRESLDPAELPVEFRRLTAREIEDCLCIYKDEFVNVRA